MAGTDYIAVTELPGDDVTTEQVERMCRRYYWAGDYCRDKDVLEVACGAGQGVGYLASLAKSVKAGDYSAAILGIARRHYGERFEFQQFDAQQMPFPDQSIDVVLIFEAIYYIPDADKFFRECKRVLRPGGTLLIATANKDLYDFNPSTQSYRYFGVRELTDILGAYGFRVEFFGDTPVAAVSLRQRMSRPVKAFTSRFGLIPKTKAGKKLLKRFVFGGLVSMPSEITASTSPYVLPAPLPKGQADGSHKVILCAAHID